MGIVDCVLTLKYIQLKNYVNLPVNTKNACIYQKKQVYLNHERLLYHHTIDTFTNS